MKTWAKMLIATQFLLIIFLVYFGMQQQKQTNQVQEALNQEKQKSTNITKEAEKLAAKTIEYEVRALVLGEELDSLQKLVENCK